MADPAPNNAFRNPQDIRGGGGVMPTAPAQHSGLVGWFEGAYSRTVSAAESAYHDVAGAVDYGYHAATHAMEVSYTVVTDEMRSFIDSVPDRIAHAANWPQLRYWAEIALGAQSFQVGVGVGMVKNLADGVWGLLKMLKMFVLAGLYEQAHASSQVAGAAASPQTYLIAKAADLVMGAQMKAADEQARALVKEVGHLVAHPGELLTALGQQYKEKWDRFAELSKQNSISSRFEAGEIVGDVLMDIIMLIQLAEGAAKLVSKVPKLLEEAEKLATKVPEIAKAAKVLGTVKKVESLENLAKDARAVKEPIRTAKPEVGSSNGVPAAAEEAPAPKDVAGPPKPVKATKADYTNPKPNTLYESNGYYYRTDAEGRLTEVSGDLRLKKAERNPYQQAKVGHSSGIAGDEGGHMVGAQFDGLGEGPLHLVPQAMKVNRGAGSEWVKMETQWANALRRGEKVSFNTVIDWPPGATRPEAFSVEYSITDSSGNIKRYAKTFENLNQ